jgi:hypothetical protein
MQRLVHVPSFRATLDELAIEALASSQTDPAVGPADSGVKLEIQRDDDLDLAVTGRFVRWSAPYERIELDASPASSIRHARPTTFVRTVSVPLPPAATVGFDKVWFDETEDAIATLEDPPAEPGTSWRWLAISIAAGGAVVAALQYLI